jgi:hypothetical protein
MVGPFIWTDKVRTYETVRHPFIHSKLVQSSISFFLSLMREFRIRIIVMTCHDIRSVIQSRTPSSWCIVCLSWHHRHHRSSHSFVSFQLMLPQQHHLFSSSNLNSTIPSSLSLVVFWISFTSSHSFHSSHSFIIQTQATKIRHCLLHLSSTV